MTKNAGNTACSVMEELNARFATTTADMFVPPDEPAPKGAIIVGELPPEFKRWHVMRSAIADEHNKLAKEHSTALSELAKAVKGRGLLQTIFHGIGEENAAKFEELKAAKPTLQRLHDLHEIASNMFWLDIRAAFPEIADKPHIGVADGGQIYGSDETPDDGPMSIEVISVGGTNLPPGLREALEKALKK